MNENELSEKIIGLAIKVHSVLGPGLLYSKGSQFVVCKFDTESPYND